jgi:VWFA-related protein
MRPIHQCTAVVWASLCCSGQVDKPTFRSATTLVEFPIVALDANGKPVRDLKKDEIELADRGKRREIAYLLFNSAEGAENATPLPPGDFSNRSDHRPSLRRSVAAIVMDIINTAPSGGLGGQMQESNYQDAARLQVLRYLTALPPNMLAGLFRLASDKVTRVCDFTDNLVTLRAQIGKLDLNQRTPQIDVGFPDVASSFGDALPAAAGDAAKDAVRTLSNYNEGVRDDRLQMTLAGLESLGDYMSVLPGRKSIIWITVGMPTVIETDRWVKTYEPLIQRTARRLASKGIAVYGVPAIAAVKNNPALEVLAETTGGRVMRVANNPASGLVTAAADNNAVYTVGFYSSDKPDNQWHDVRVSAKRPGVKLDYRQGYLADAAPGQPQEWSREQWQAAISSSLGSSALRLDARCRLGTRAEAGTVFVATRFQLTDLVFGTHQTAQIEIAYVEKKGDETYNIQRRAAVLNYTDSNGGSVQSAHSWKLDSATKTIRVILHDKLSGRYGTVDVPVKNIPAR